LQERGWGQRLQPLCFELKHDRRQRTQNSATLDQNENKLSVSASKHLHAAKEEAERKSTDANI
jgi:hypothetical protein